MIWRQACNSYLTINLSDFALHVIFYIHACVAVCSCDCRLKWVFPTKRCRSNVALTFPMVMLMVSDFQMQCFNIVPCPFYIASPYALCRNLWVIILYCGTGQLCRVAYCMPHFALHRICYLCIQQAQSAFLPKCYFETLCSSKTIPSYI